MSPDFAPWHACVSIAGHRCWLTPRLNGSSGRGLCSTIQKKKKRFFFMKPSSTRPGLHICCCSHPSFSTRHSFSARDGHVCLSCALTLPTSYLDLKFLLVEFATISSLLFCIFIKWDKEELLQNRNRSSRTTNTICWVCPRNCRTHMSPLTL